MTNFPSQALITPPGFILAFEKQNNKGNCKYSGGEFIPSCYSAVNEPTEEAMQ
jgi:hypothetical protein